MEAAINPVSTTSSWRLKLEDGAAPVELSREELLAMEQYTESLPIACVEGWSTTQDWTGVRISDLAALAGIEGAPRSPSSRWRRAAASTRRPSPRARWRTSARSSRSR